MIFLIVSDMDKKSRKGQDCKEWMGILKAGRLKRDDTGRYTVEWLKEYNITSAYNEACRGMELSELVYFDEKLLACDDRTGIIFELELDDMKVVPRYILTLGDGNYEKGFKCEWMTVVNDKLYVGSIGKEWSQSESNEYEYQWIKIINREGHIEHVQWRKNYEALRKKSGTEFPGYLLHEAIMWNPQKREWVIMPRRFSTEPYDEAKDEQRGSNKIFFANEDFTTIEMKKIGEENPLLGTSSFKFIPFRDDEIIQLKTIESGNRIQSYLAVVNIQTGKVLMEDTDCGYVKYEGVEII